MKCLCLHRFFRKLSSSHPHRVLTLLHIPLARPYGDGFIITAQLISIVAFLLSWFWWVAFLISAIGMIWLQVIWCCRQNKIGFWALAATCGIAAILCLFAGIWMLVVWKDASWCVFFLWWTEYYYSSDSDGCNEGLWARIAFVEMVLWCIVTVLLLYFVYSERHQKWENRWGNRRNATEVELPTVQVEAIPISKDGDGELAHAITI